MAMLWGKKIALTGCLCFGLMLENDVASAEPTANHAASSRRVAKSVTASVPRDVSVIRLPQLSVGEGVQVAALATRLTDSDSANRNATPSASDRAPGGSDSNELANAPYWLRAIQEQTDQSQAPLMVSQESLIISALEHSAQVKVFSDLPLIRETSIVEAQANFDWRAFADTKWNDLNDPVGNTLTTGHSGRYNNHQWTANGGVRRLNELGGKTELAQQFGFQNTNSNFFVPNDQGTARLILSYTQPLLKGAGRCYNSRVTVLAQLDASVAENELVRQLESHLLEVSRSYWSLYLERGNVAQKREHLKRAQKVLAELERRQEIDALESQILRGRAAVAARDAELFRVENAVQNAEGRIRALVNSPEFVDPSRQELVPSDVPTVQKIPYDLDYARQVATQNRPEIQQAFKQIRASAERLSMAQNEVLPALDLVLQSYVAGLRGNSAVGDAWADQFSRGAPSYTAGLVYEVPFGNRIANTRLERRQLELRQVTSQLQVTMETLMLEVDVAVREIETSYRELDSKLKSANAAQAEVQYLERRWKHMAGDGVQGASVLHELFTAQDRLAAAEFSYLQSLVTYNLALINVKKATGTLLQEEQIVMGRGTNDCLPVILPEKMGGTLPSIVAPVEPQQQLLPTPATTTQAPKSQAPNQATPTTKIAPDQNTTVSARKAELTSPVSFVLAQAPAPIRNAAPTYTARQQLSEQSSSRRQAVR